MYMLADYILHWWNYRHPGTGLGQIVKLSWAQTLVSIIFIVKEIIRDMKDFTSQWI